MNELQKKEFEMLKLFTEICDSLGLTYYLVRGSALGAVKYGGFIPWDDDIDVALPRKDYERFLSEAPALLPENIFLQNYRTDPEYPGMGSKLRNSDTAFIENEARNIRMNHGIFIDVFPLDGYPQNPQEQKEFEKKKWKLYRRRYTKLIPFYHRDLGLTLTSLMYKCFGLYKNTAEACREYEELIKKYPPDNSPHYCNYANSMKKTDYSPREHYGEGKDGVFEGLKVRLPVMTDEYLTQLYGDWRADLPEEKKVSGHPPAVADTEKSYKEYV